MGLLLPIIDLGNLGMLVIVRGQVSNLVMNIWLPLFWRIWSQDQDCQVRVSFNQEDAFILT